jgi:hypothetical protein
MHYWIFYAEKKHSILLLDEIRLLGTLCLHIKLSFSSALTSLRDASFKCNETNNVFNQASHLPCLVLSKIDLQSGWQWMNAWLFNKQQEKEGFK